MEALDTYMASFGDWLEGARLRTLPAAAAPVFIGVGAAYLLGGGSAGKSALALGVALSLQIGVNFANDYSDGVKGTDQQRVGPTRLTASGLVPAKTVLSVALGCFVAAGVLGLALIAWSGLWWLLVVGGASVAAAWYYTGGKKPYGYMGVGLSELFVFVFFGLVATVGTTYVQSYSAPWWLWLAASGIGFVSIALLMVNNIRDIPTDMVTGKITIPVRLGDGLSRFTYVALMTASVVLGGISLLGAGTNLTVTIVIAALLLVGSLPGVVGVVSGKTGRGLLPALRNTGLYALMYGLVVGLGFAVGAGTHV